MKILESLLNGDENPKGSAKVPKQYKSEFLSKSGPPKPPLSLLCQHILSLPKSTTLNIPCQCTFSSYGSKAAGPTKTFRLVIVMDMKNTK